MPTLGRLLHEPHQREIHTGEEHEDDDDDFNCRRIIAGNAGISCGKTTAGHGREGVIDSIEHRHSSDEFQRQHPDERQHEVKSSRAIVVCLDLDEGGTGGSGQFRTGKGHTTTDDARGTSIPSITTPFTQPLGQRAPQQQTTGWALIQSGVVPGIQFGLTAWEARSPREVVKPDMDSNQEFTNRKMSMKGVVNKGPTNTPPNQYGRHHKHGQGQRGRRQQRLKSSRWAESVRQKRPSMAVPKPPLMSMAEGPGAGSLSS